ncbi:MAG: DnaJ domain-containing protein [Myxococcota bacterium]|nr:DnaJ domain-containing protein [Myxococcota bacterium]
MIDSSQKLAQLALGKSRAQSYGLVCAGSDVGAQFYSVLAACNLVVETLDDMSKLVQSVTLKTRLVVLGDQNGQGRIGDICKRLKRLEYSHQLAILVLSNAFSDREFAIRQQQIWGVDLCLPKTTPKDVLIEKVSSALIDHRPISEFGCLPIAIANEIDSVLARIHTGNYYTILGVVPKADEAQIRSAFHQLAQVLHPDRHRARAAQYGRTLRRIADAYKRVSEIHSVLTSTTKRREYDLCLLSATSLRHEPEKLPQPLRSELELCKTRRARVAVVESLIARLTGHWKSAYKSMHTAVSAEPDNFPLRDKAESVKKVYMLCAASHSVSNGNWS